MREAWRAMQEQRHSPKGLDEPELPLQYSGGGGTSGGVERAQVEDMIARSQAESRQDFAVLKGSVDTRMAEVLGEVRVIGQAMTDIQRQLGENRNDDRTSRQILWGIALGLMAIFATLFAGFGPTWFGHHDQQAPAAVIPAPSNTQVDMPSKPSVPPLPNGLVLENPTH